MVRAPSIDKNGIKKGEWSKEEDDKLKAYINRYGIWNWRQLPKYAGLSRCGKSCRLRWKNYLQPDVKRGNFTKEEEDIIINLHNQLGKKWSIFAKHLPGRTDNEIKNYWHTHLKKRTQGQNNLTPPSNQVKAESSCQTPQILKEEIKREPSQTDNNHHQISTLGLCQGLTSPSVSGCSTGLSRSYYDAPSHQESSGNIWNQDLMVEDYELAQGSSCSDFSFSYSDDSNMSNLMTAGDHTTITPTYECFDDFWSQLLETDYMVSSYKHQQPFVDPVNIPSSPIADEVFLWSYDLSSDESNR